MNAYKWQDRRLAEKNHQAQLRLDRTSQPAEDIKLSSSEPLPWEGMDSKALNEQFAYKPFKFYGKFDNSKEILVERQHKGDRGYQVYTPFYCYFSEEGNPEALIVDRGWIPLEYKTNKFHHMKADQFTEITGIVYKGDYSTKDSKFNEPAFETYRVAKAGEFAKVMGLSEHAKSCFIKQIDLNEHDKSIFPQRVNKFDLTNWVVKPEDHKYCSNLWKLAFFGNVFVNTFLWIYL